MKNEVSENFISEYDKEIKDIADYTINFSNFSELSRQTAYHVLLDSIACGILALKNESCIRFRKFQEIPAKCGKIHVHLHVFSIF